MPPACLSPGCGSNAWPTRTRRAVFHVASCSPAAPPARLALALPRRVRAVGQPTVVIVGAGIAGLTCALELADHDIASTVYEASGRIGGRMFTNTSYFAAEQVAEWGGELIDTGHKTIRKLANRFGLALDDLLDAQPRRSEDTYRFFGRYYPKAQADVDFAPVFDAVVADEASAPFPTTFDNFTTEGAALDALSVYDWIESRVPGGHGSPLGMLLDTAYAIEYGADTTRAGVAQPDLPAGVPAQGRPALASSANRTSASTSEAATSSSPRRSPTISESATRW